MLWTIVLALLIAWFVITALPLLFWAIVWLLFHGADKNDKADGTPRCDGLSDLRSPDATPHPVAH